MMTAKNSKKELFAEVERVLKESPVLEKNWVDRAKYAIKAGLEKCSKTDLLSLLKDAADFIKTPTPAPVENSTKPSLKKPKQKAEETTEAEEKEEKTEKATSKKKLGKKTAEKTPDKVEGAEKLSKKSFDTAKIFPKTLEVKDLGTLEVRNTEFKSMSEVTEAINEGRELYFATYWTPRMLKEFAYAQANGVPCPKAFDSDLDILMAVVTCTNVERVWAMSVYTEAMYAFNGEDLTAMTEKDTDGNEYAIRVANGLKFEIYEKVSE